MCKENLIDFLVIWLDLLIYATSTPSILGDVQGYVKNVTAKGCFLMLSRVIDARILLSNLSDGFVVNPAAEFPIGKLVCGK